MASIYSSFVWHISSFLKWVVFKTTFQHEKDNRNGQSASFLTGLHTWLVRVNHLTLTLFVCLFARALDKVDFSVSDPSFKNSK